MIYYLDWEQKSPETTATKWQLRIKPTVNIGCAIATLSNVQQTIPSYHCDDHYKYTH